MSSSRYTSTRLRNSVRLFAAATLILASITACGGDGGTPPLTAVGSVSLPASPQPLRVGQSVSLTATVLDAAGAPIVRAVTYSSSAPTIASVSATGVVVAISPGAANITATADGRSGSIGLTVLEATAAVSVDRTSAVLLVGRTLRLIATARDAAGQSIPGLDPRWSSGSPLVASVSPNGLVTALSDGIALLTATIDDRTATVAVTVVSSRLTRLTLRPSKGFLPLGSDYGITVSAFDADGFAVPTPPVTFSSSATDVATVSAAGVARALKLGSVTISATTAEGAVSTVALEVVATRTMGGTVTTLDGGPATGLQFSAWLAAGTTAEQRFNAPVVTTGGNGQFTLTLPVVPIEGGAFELVLDAAPGTARLYHPSYGRLGAGGTPPATTSILLVPHSIVIDSGSYAGTRVPVSLNSAFTPVCTTGSDSNCQSYWPSYWITGIKMWPDAERPVPLAIDRSGVTPVIGAADSTALWSTIREMELDLGRRLYRPATFGGYTTPGYQSGTVLATIDASLPVNQGYTNWSWNSQGQLYEGRMRLGALVRFNAASLLTHELLHAQGLSHTCQWSTVMGGYGCGSFSRLTQRDVAYYHLAQLARRRTEELTPTWGLREALAGERRVEMGIGTILAATGPLPAILQRLLLDAPRAGHDSSAHGAASSSSARNAFVRTHRH